MKKKGTPSAAKKAEPKSVDPAQKSIIGENIKFTLTVPWAEVEKAKDHALEHLAEHAQLDGFRKGKAPKKLIEEKLGKQKVFEAAMDEMLPQAYTVEVRKRGLKPIVNPQINPISLDDGKPWEFAVETAEAPKITLGNYQETVRGAKSTPAILIPGKNAKPPEETEEDKLRIIFTALLEKYKVVIPELLIRTEVNRTLSQFLEQLDRMHVPLEDYLKSVSKTADQLRQEYAMSALTSLQLEFILASIAAAEKIDVTEKELDEVIAALPNDEIRKVNNTPTQRMNIRGGLIKKKTIAHVMSL